MFARELHEAFTPEERRQIMTQLDAEREAIWGMKEALDDNDLSDWHCHCEARKLAMNALNELFRVAVERGRVEQDGRALPSLRDFQVHCVGFPVRFSSN